MSNPPQPPQQAPAWSTAEAPTIRPRPAAEPIDDVADDPYDIPEFLKH